MLTIYSDQLSGSLALQGLVNPDSIRKSIRPSRQVVRNSLHLTGTQATLTLVRTSAHSRYAR